MVGAAPVSGTVVPVNLHPPPNEPWSPTPSSTTYNDHVPLADCPLNADNAVPYGPAGAGAGNVSPVSKSVGLYVPETIGPLSANPEPAPSDNVRFTLFTPVPPPTSDSSIAFCPVGPTNKMSKSSGKVWVRPFNVTPPWLIVPAIPETLIVEGYGVAAPKLGIVIAAALVNSFVPVNSDTVSEKASLAVNTPSLTVTVIVAVPVCP